MLQVPEKTVKQREEELKRVVGSINSIKNAAKWIEKCTGPMNALQLNFKVVSDLPIAPSDLRSIDAPRIYDLLDQVLNYCISLTYSPTEDRLSISSEASRS
jgi:hypothetical protein